ncbi:hypothetical protein K0T92_09290 [Paenibacillus oenotherae]|uniref:Uncharacterized protein n=1 Tax=Paenibacillus oenotherae TaxID=1435645 RepID=A0ABS7D6Z4_9BACL|nr:hypothetical protein [Paenibacillus oenotherae]MBW7474938.1 hypothetical protein [Paenibacillus oenotherae]
MNLTILQAKLHYSEEDLGYAGFVHFEVEGHKVPYELTLLSKKKRDDDWMYSINFLTGHGSEEQINEVEAQLEENDELFDSLIDAAKATLES